MKHIAYYEFAATLIPGVVLMFGLSRIYPELRLSASETGTTVGDMGLIVLLAYPVGQMVQVLGNGIEWLVWRALGKPSDGVRTGKGAVVSRAQRAGLRERIVSELGIPQPQALEDNSAQDWAAIVAQMVSAIGEASGGRIESFNRAYGMNRGVAAALLILAACVVARSSSAWPLACVLVGLAVLSLYRMRRFDNRYAREVMVQFLQPPRHQTARKEEKGSEE